MLYHRHCLTSHTQEPCSWSVPQKETSCNSGWCGLPRRYHHRLPNHHWSKNTAEDDDLVDVPALKKKTKVCRKSQHRNLRKLAEQVGHNRRHFEDKLKLTTLNIIVDKTKNNSTHYKPFINDNSSGTASLINFVNDLRCKSMACTWW